MYGITDADISQKGEEEVSVFTNISFGYYRLYLDHQINMANICHKRDSVDHVLNNCSIFKRIYDIFFVKGVPINTET